MSFNQLLTELNKKKGSLCLTIRAQREKIPFETRRIHCHQPYHFLIQYFKKIIDTCGESAMGIEFDVPSFQTFGHEGIHGMEVLLKYAREEKKIFCIYGGTISASTQNAACNGERAEQLSDHVYSIADAVNLNPYFGNKDGIADFLIGAPDNGGFITCKTAGFHEGEFQNLLIDPENQTHDHWDKFGNYPKRIADLLEMKAVPLWLLTAYRMSDQWGLSGKCSIAIDGLALEANIALTRKAIREDMHILIPYRENIKQILAKGRLKNTDRGVFVKISDEIIYALAGDNYADAAAEKAKFFKSLLAEHS